MTKFPYVLVGLGNPGDKYTLNRHNIGFLAIDAVCKFFNAPRYQEKYHSHMSTIEVDGHSIIIMKPQTFMNLSGKAVAELMRFYKIPITHLYVVHDELDLEPGRIKVKQGGSDGGHNGLASITQHLGANYHRVRLGIGHPGHKDLVTGYVLSNFSKNDQNWVEPLLWTVGKELPHLLGQEAPKWLNHVNHKLKEM